MNGLFSVGIGALHMGSFLNKEESRNLILHALESGVRFFDTAPLYGNGFSEEILGDVLSETGQSAREKAFICTKVGLKAVMRKDQKFGVELARLNGENICKSVEASLKKLKRDCIDLLMLHAFDAETAIEETLYALIKLREEGKIKGLGCSNYNPDQLKYLIGKTNKEFPLLAAQCHYNLIERRANHKLIPLCDQKDVCVVVNRALARGALSGHYSTSQGIPPDSRGAKSKRIQKWLTPHKLNLLDDLSQIAKKNGVSLMEIALKWLRKKHPKMLVLLGVRSIGQFNESLKAFSKEINDSVFDEIEERIRKEGNVHQFPPRYFEK